MATYVFFVTAQQSCTKSNIRQVLTIFVKFGRLVVLFDTNKDYFNAYTTFTGIGSVLVFLSTGLEPPKMVFFFMGSCGHRCMATRIKVSNGKLIQIKNS